MDKKALKITDILCQNCGAAVSFDIYKQNYLCEHCGSRIEIEEAREQKKGYRKIRSNHLKDSIRNYKLAYAVCDGCGARVVFAENEALSVCSYCGKSLVRSDYFDLKDFPESVIPFVITLQEARSFLKDWCDKNRSKKEARQLKKHINELQGSYLPYELIRGPVHMKVSRMDSDRSYHLEGFINGEFVNRSRQLNNLLLDGMEPYDIDGLSEFNFGYVAGHHVRIADINDYDLEKRVKKESEETYKPAVEKVMNTSAVEVDADVSSAIRLPVLLPVYYFCKDDLMAAVNGQTGKVSVMALKESHYYFLPWWLKAILSTLFATVLTGSACHLLGMSIPESFGIAAMLGLVLLIVTLCLYSDTRKNRFAVEAGKEIYTSGEKTFHRQRDGLVQSDRILSRKLSKPVFFEKIEEKYRPVELKFNSPGRILKTVVLTIIAIFLPVILALLINGFDFSKIRLGGSAAWFCIMVPVVPVYVLKFAIVELYERPWIYLLQDDGRKKRYRKKYPIRMDIKEILEALFIPPVSLAVWFGIASFIVMVYLTAGYGW